MSTTAKRVDKPFDPQSSDNPSVPYGRSVPVNESPFRDPTPDDVRSVAPEPAKSKAETELIIEALTQFYAAAGIGLAFFPSAAMDGMIVTSNASDLAESWRDLLDNDPKVRKVLRKLLKSSAWGTVITAHAAVCIAIAKNHPDGISHLVKRKTNQTDAVS